MHDGKWRDVMWDSWNDYTIVLEKKLAPAVMLDGVWRDCVCGEGE